MTLFFIVIIVVLAFMCLYFNTILPFMDERKYIKTEMERSYDKSEYIHWQHELKRLYRRYIPIVKWFK